MTGEGREETSGPLKGHFRVGKTFTPPMLALVDVHLGNWTRDDLPDMIWPAMLIADKGDAGLEMFMRLQARFGEVLDLLDIPAKSATFDGRLTSIESMDTAHREAIVEAFAPHLRSTGAVSEKILAVLRNYEGFPGAWLLVEPFADLELDITSSESATYLARVLVDLMTDEHKEATLKFATITWRVVARTFSASKELIEEWQVYPRGTTNMAKTDCSIRASFGSMKAMASLNDPGLDERILAWAKDFWAINMRSTPCFLNEDVAPAEQDLTPAGEKESAEPESVDAVDEVLVEWNRFLDGFLGHSELDLYDPARHEVISGLITRATRAVVAHLRSPHFWGGEHGSALTRLLTETEIILTWMSLNGDDSYRAYQAYGDGKAKLHGANLAGLAAEFGDNVPEMLTTAIEHLDKKTGGEWGGQFVPVSVDSTFSGKSMRTMAQQSGLEGLYRHVYQGASSVTHGEWWTVEDYSMQRCRNPLHRFHRVPSMEPVGGNEPLLARYWIDTVSRLISQALEQIVPDEEDKSTGSFE